MNPRVSLIVACKNVERFVDDALMSARRQSLADIEILAVDDCSTDGTLDRLLAHAGADARVHVLQGQGRGPGAARNVALAAARGEWVAILDSDDFLHPRRLEWMLERATATDADIVADNLLAFQSEDRTRLPYLLFPTRPDSPGEFIDLAHFVRSNCLFGRSAPLGYLKPVIRRTLLESKAYDERLRIGEDFELLARLMTRGAKLYRDFRPLYFYRRHESSTSFRMRSDDIDNLNLVFARTARTFDQSHQALSKACREYLNSLARARAFMMTVDNLKAGNIGSAVREVLHRPQNATLLFEATISGLQRRIRRLRAGSAQAPRTVVSPDRRVIFLDAAGVAPPAFEAYLRRQGYDLEVIRIPAAGSSIAGSRSALDGLSGDEMVRLGTRGSSARFIAAGEDCFDALPFLIMPHARLVAVVGEGVPHNVPGADLVWSSAHDVPLDRAFVAIDETNTTSANDQGR